MSYDVKQLKKEIREQYRAIRNSIDKNYFDFAAESLVKTFNQNLNLIKGKIIAAYIPMDGEINVIPLMYHLLNLGYKIAIPHSGKLLSFKEWKTGEDMIPDTIITPVVAFDDNFNRLGFGGGWYDTIIKNFYPRVIGVAYEQQYYKNLPTEEHDQRLDAIITEICVRCKTTT